MKNLLKKFHIMPNQLEDTEGSSSRGSKFNDGSTRKVSPLLSSTSPHHHHSQRKPSSGLSGWLNSVTNRHNPSSALSSNVGREERTDSPSDSFGSSGLDLALDTVMQDLESSTSRDLEVEEEYQIQLALEMSAREDPEAVQIEAIKQISLDPRPPQNTPAEVIAYRYWNYNALSYNDKILDGFYDLYGFFSESTSEVMPSLVDLQGTPISDSIRWEAVLVNRAVDAHLLKLEQKALMMVVESRSESLGFVVSDLVQELAALVTDYMGGPIGDPDSMLRSWRDLSNSLRTTFGSMVLPLGYLTIGLVRHRALLFKVLADSVGIPCQLVKGQQYTGSDDVAINIVKVDDGREYIVDLMADPGTLIPSDSAGPQIEYEEPFSAITPFLRDCDYSHIASSSSGVTNSFGGYSGFEKLDKISRSGNLAPVENESDNQVSFSEFEFRGLENSRVGFPQESLSNPNKCEVEPKLSDDFTSTHMVEKALAQEIPTKPNRPYMLARSPSWTEGISSPAARGMKVKDVSQYMIDAAKENPQLAQKLHDVLLESGVVAPPDLFTEINTENLDSLVVDKKIQIKDKDEEEKGRNGIQCKGHADLGPDQNFPPLPYLKLQSKASPISARLEHLKPVENLGINHQQDLREMSGMPSSPHSEVSAALLQETSPLVAAAKSGTELNLEVPLAGVATTAAAMVATTAAISMQLEQVGCCDRLLRDDSYSIPMDCVRNDSDADVAGYGPRGSCDGEHDVAPEGERGMDRSAGNDSPKSNINLDDVAEWEISWEEITLGERIGLGSYGEVYHGEWHGTEVAVKKFLDQDISGDALEEFRSEVRIMKRLRHPNVLLFMGAVTRAPNLSIVTEFLPRGSLYRLIHRPNNQFDERRRLKIALDVARGMNYLHNCTPVIVHRDLKSPNLLVDKNWVVKVCDFGLSRMKHSTFLSSRSAVGTAEWMAPEVLRNEPSDEKCDVFSFGVILWELSTLQLPWRGMNPMQVVGAVGFQHRRLDIPDFVDPIIADIIMKCWQTDPKLRPSFSEIMAVLKPLQKPITTAQVPRSRAPISSDQNGGQS